MLIMRARKGVNMKCLGPEVNHTGTESLDISSSTFRAYQMFSNCICLGGQ